MSLPSRNGQNLLVIFFCMTKFTGWFAIILCILSLAPSLVPGAISIMGLALSLVALYISLYSIIDSGKKYFHITLFIVITGVLFVNDAMRLWEPLAPLNVRMIFYAVFILILLIFIIIAHHFAKPHSDTHD